MGLTPYGKLVRKHRIDEGMTLNEMAKELDKTPAFLSSIETGRKSVPDGMAEKVAIILDLDPGPKEELLQAALMTKKEHKLRVPRGAPQEDKQLAAMFARQFSEMTDEKKDRLRKILMERHA